MKKKILKIFLWIVSITAAVILIAVIGAYSYFKFYLAPKLSQGNQAGDANISFTEVAKDLSDKQVIDNIINFDKQSASEMLVAMNELATEMENEVSKTDGKATETAKEPEVQVPKEGTTAYQRIMNTASKDEISQGMAIASKVDISKVTELRKQGKNSEIKEYLKSVLTSEEISTALNLYKKYKHLL